MEAVGHDVAHVEAPVEPGDLVHQQRVLAEEARAHRANLIEALVVIAPRPVQLVNRAVAPGEPAGEPGHHLGVVVEDPIGAVGGVGLCDPLEPGLDPDVEPPDPGPLPVAAHHRVDVQPHRLPCPSVAEAVGLSRPATRRHRRGVRVGAGEPAGGQLCEEPDEDHQVQLLAQVLDHIGAGEAERSRDRLEVRPPALVDEGVEPGRLQRGELAPEEPPVLLAVEGRRLLEVRRVVDAADRKPGSAVHRQVR